MNTLCSIFLGLFFISTASIVESMPILMENQTYLELSSSPPEFRCEYLLSLLEKAAGQDYIGEPISQLGHALQAAYLASQSGADDETILAALFHDIGHLCASESKKGEYGVPDHDVVGADFLHLCGMSNKVCELVLGHVQAKRYLTFLYPEYYAKLSDASKKTLEMQGGPMTSDEAATFEKDPFFDLKIQMRSWDEQAKVVGLSVPELSAYHQMLLDHLLAF